MKIFPSTHKIKSVTDSHIDLDLNIPLARVDLDYEKYDIEKLMEKIASKEEKKEVLMNQEFDSASVKLFNKFNEAVNMDNLLTRYGDKYYYRPKDMISFSPQLFQYNATIKKNIDYKISNLYNINISCVDDPDSLDLSKRLAAGFSNPSSRDITPPNISINNNRMDAQSFTDMTLKDCDILFIESPDGRYYSDGLNPVKIDKDIFLQKNTTIWLGSDFNLDYPSENTQGGTEYTVSTPILNSKVTVISNSYFNFETLPYKEGTIYHNIFNSTRIPVLIIEHPGKGYEILSSSDVFNNIVNNIKLMYECIMYCFLKGYKSTENITQWICSKVPDYQIESGKLVKKRYFMSDINLHRFFNLKDSEMMLYSVNIQDSENSSIPTDKTQDLYEPSSSVIFAGLSGGRLMFDKVVDKNSPYNIEPEKPTGWISLYDGTNVIYVKEIHYTIETNLEDKIFTVIDKDNLNIKILSFKSTILGVDTQTPFDKVIPFIKTEVNKVERIREAEYSFFINIDNQKIDFVFAEDYKDELGVKLFAIKVFQTPDAVKVTDMRQLGGGLVESASDNYNLLDIGHIEGRPYRKTGTVIFTLPTKFKEHEELILKAINKYIGASDVPIILFEDNK